MNYEIVPLPKEKWKGTSVPIRYTTDAYYDLELTESDSGFTARMVKKQFDTPVTHRPEEYNYPDKLYLTDDRIPAWEEYDIIKGRKPLYSTMKDQDPKEVAAYSHAVLAFRKKHADILYDGNFRSDDGFTLASGSPNVIARSFIKDGKMGVVVWNISDDQPVEFTVTPDKGWKLVETDAPEGTPAEGALPAQTLRLLIFSAE